ncbi:MAG: hypothetical protein ABJK37_11405 [Paraglaciecola sp.]|uniref:hypothetical protein n=1 Tax=Paraglaciecola sp. TaxID=1920173 RepID=UPI00329A3E28
MKQYFFPILCSVFSLSVIAHENQTNNIQPDSLDVKTTMTFRSDESFPIDQVWQIPGLLMGGEALPVEKGASLDDVQLLGHLNLGNNYFVNSKIGAHSHDGSAELELENLWFGANTQLLGQTIIFEAGKMATQVTPTANFHASSGAFSESPLLADIFLGGHFVDIGARASSHLYGVNVGLEVWNGDNWPATSGEGAAALYIHYPYQDGGFKAQLGSWLMSSHAETRKDQRYDGGHSHGNEQLSASDLEFSGDTLTMGIFASFQWQLNPIVFNSEFEWIRADIDAQLVDTTQSADLLATHDGYKIQFGMSLDKHSVQVKYERLVIDNRFTNTSQLFIQSSGLYNVGFEPQKLAVSWTWDFYQNFKFRSEWYQDDTQEQGSSRWSLGLVWQYKLL